MRSESAESSLPEVRRLGSQFWEFLPGVQRLSTLEELLLGFNPLWIRDTAVDGTHGRALLALKMADAFSTLLGNDVIEIVGQRVMHLTVQLPRDTGGIDSNIRTFRLACAAINTFLGNHRRH